MSADKGGEILNRLSAKVDAEEQELAFAVTTAYHA